MRRAGGGGSPRESDAGRAERTASEERGGTAELEPTSDARSKWSVSASAPSASLCPRRGRDNGALVGGDVPAGRPASAMLPPLGVNQANGKGKAESGACCGADDDKSPAAGPGRASAACEGSSKKAGRPRCVCPGAEFPPVPPLAPVPAASRASLAPDSGKGEVTEPAPLSSAAAGASACSVRRRVRMNPATAAPRPSASPARTCGGRMREAAADARNGVAESLPSSLAVGKGASNGLGRCHGAARESAPPKLVPAEAPAAGSPPAALVKPRERVAPASVGAQVWPHHAAVERERAPCGCGPEARNREDSDRASAASDILREMQGEPSDTIEPVAKSLTIALTWHIPGESAPLAGPGMPGDPPTCWRDAAIRHRTPERRSMARPRASFCLAQINSE